MQENESNSQFLPSNNANLQNQSVGDNSMSNIDFTAMQAFFKMFTRPTSGENRDSSPGFPFFHQVKMPELKLPIFDGEKYKNLHAFLAQLEDAFKRDRTTEPSKFLYLKGQLKGKPLEMVESLHVGQQKYSFVKNLLMRAYARPMAEKFDLIQKMTEMKYADPITYFGTINDLKSSVNFLNMSIMDVLLYFSWKGFPNNMRTVLSNITGKSNLSLDEIEDQIFEAASRLKEHAAFRNEEKKKFEYKSKPKKEVANLATNVATSNKEKQDLSSSKKPEAKKTTKNKPKSSQPKKKKFCSLCYSDEKEANHFLAYCEVYKQPRTKLNVLNNFVVVRNVDLQAIQRLSARCRPSITNVANAQVITCPFCAQSLKVQNLRLQSPKLQV